MGLSTVYDTRFGYSTLDQAIGDWNASDDVAAFTNVRHPERDEKTQVRELLRLLGKRFATPLARLIWQEIENYREEMVQRFGPKTGAVGRIPFEEAAVQWYHESGPQFEKRWYLTVSTAELNYARTGREHIQGRWIRMLQPNLAYFVDAGFSPMQIMQMLYRIRHDWWRIFPLLGKIDGPDLARLWVKLAAGLIGFRLEGDSFDRVLAEVAEHSARLSYRQKYPVDAAVAAIDYFRRLELAQIGPSVLLVKA